MESKKNQSSRSSVPRKALMTRKKGLFGKKNENEKEDRSAQ